MKGIRINLSAKLLKIVLTAFIILQAFNSFAANWYPLVSGDWDNPAIWTLDPSGALYDNPDGYTPSTSPTSATDEVYILSGRTVYVSSNGKTNAKLTVTGRIDFRATTGHTFTEIRGSGKIILKADNFPSGDATHFISKDQGEGTVVFDSTGYNLNTPHTFYNVEVNLDNPGDILTILADYQINGSLDIIQGEFRINDNSSTTTLDLDVDGDVSVSSNASIRVGTANATDGGATYYHQYYHEFTVGGDFTNYGTIRLTNQTVPDYDTRTTTGAVSLIFDGVSHNYFDCYNTTDLYYLVINKGIDPTYELELYADDKSYFALFGDNNSAYTTTDPNADNNKALWIQTGALRLKGEIVIPTLTEGGNDWPIGENATLIIDGENVEVYSTTDNTFSWTGFSHGTPNGINNGTSNQALYLYGTLSMEDGFYSSATSSGINYRDEAAGTINISGGEISTTQLRISGFATTGYYSFIQSGGIFRVRGNGEVKDSEPIFGLVDPNMVFSMSGGQLIIDATTTTGAIEIQSDEGNFNVTGGEVICNWGSTSTINTIADLYNVSVTVGTDVDLANDLSVLNDLTIDATSGLDAAGYDLSIEGDFIFEDGASFTHSNNTTYFSGDQNSSIIIENNSTANVLQFYDLVIDKDQLTSSTYYDVGIAECTGRTEDPTQALNSIIQIQNDFTITRGQFTTERYTVNLSGDFTITDGKLVYNDALPGRLTLNGTTQQTLTGSAIYNPEFGYIELDNTNGATISTDISLSYFILTNGILDINEYKFSLDTNVIEGTGFGTTKMIMTQGESGDRGLEYTFNLSSSTAIGTIALYPVGTSGRYNPVDVVLNNTLGSSYSGTMRVSPIDDYHPAVIIRAEPWANPQYWKTKVTGTIENISTGDITLRFYDPYSGYGSGRMEYYKLGNDWEDDGSASSSPLTYDVGFISSDFTAARNLNFNFSTIYYSRANGDWNDRNTWSTSGHSGGAVTGFFLGPLPIDVVIIGGTAAANHTVTISTNNESVAEVTIKSGDPSVAGEPTLDLGTTTGHSFDEVNGGGRLRISYNGDIPSGNFDNFIYNDTAIFEYYGGSYTIPTDFSVYPNLDITGSGTTRTMPTQDIYVRKNLLIDNETLLLSPGNDLIVDDSILFDNAGVLQFPTNAAACEVIVNKSIDLSGSSAANSIEVGTGGTYTANHSLYVRDDIEVSSNSTVTLFRGTGNKAVDLYFIGDNATNVNDDGNTTIDIALNRLIIDKTVSTTDINFLEEFSLGAPADGNSDEKALYLISGDLYIDNSVTNLTLSSGGEDFVIPSDASLNVANATMNVSGANTGIFLDGLMTVDDGSQWLINGGTNNYIEYSSSGNAEIVVNNGTLRVGSQIRRGTLTTEGILRFSQNSSSSTIILGEVDAPTAERGVFEILNAGSEFTQVANAEITIVRQQTAATSSTIYLDPETSSLGNGSGFRIGNASTPAGQSIRIYSTIDIKNIIIDNTSTNNPELITWIVPLTVDEELNIGTGTTFNANGLDLTINGDFINSGTFTPNNNTTYFSGSSDQTITGNTTFYNLTKTSSVDLELTTASTDITITNVLDIQGGTLTDNSNDIYVQGNCNFDGTHVYGGSNDGITFNGTSEQELTGSGTFGKLTIDNSEDVVVPLGNNFTISNVLNLQSGVLNIGKNLLTLELNASIDGAPFSASNMIQTNVSFTDYGVKKVLPAGASTFLYPIGAGGKYTPVDFNITSNGNSTGSITIKAADEMHPSVVDDTESPPPQLADPDNVLQYHWVIRSNGISSFSATTDMTCDLSDVIALSADYDSTDYITARLLNDGLGLWNKYDVADFDEVTGILTFNISGSLDDEISGDYTAGVDPALPDSVYSYTSNNSGNWTTSTIWTPNITGGPRGSITTVNATHIIDVTANGILNYSTQIDGTVDLGTTFAHRFGEVSGSGTIYVEMGALPAGIYDDFFSSLGGTIEYGGSTDYDVLGGISQLNNIKFSGTGERRLPNNNIVLNGDFEIDGGAGLTVINEYDKKIEIKGDLIRTTGNFDAGTGSTASILFSSAVTQNISGNFTGSNALNRVEVNNSNGVTLSGDIEIEDLLTLTNGYITPGANTLTISLNGSIVPASGSSTKYINGELTKVLTTSDDFVFPIGDNGNIGKIEFVNVSGFTGSDSWSAEYIFDNPTNDGYDASSYLTPINYVSQSEYWSVQGPAGAQSDLTITLDGSSDVASAVSDLADLRFVGWSTTNSRWEQVGGTPVVTGTATSGTITTGTAIDFDSYQYITLASTQSITLSTASIISGDATICDGESTDILVSLTGTQPWSFTYTDGITPNTINGITSSPYTLAVSPSSITTYTLTATSDNNGPGILVGDVDAEITVNSLPTITFSNNSGDDEICNGEEVIFTASEGDNYDFHLNDASDQSSTSETYTTSTLANLDEVYVVVTGSNGCSDTSSTTIIIVNNLPTINLGANPDVCQGVAVANLPYSSTTGSPDQYNIDFDNTAESENFSDVTAGLAGTPPIPITVPTSPDPAADTYNANLTVTNTTTGCESVDYAINVTVNALPTVEAGSYGPLCVDAAAITLTGTPTDAGGSWSGTGVTDNGDGTASFNPATAGSGDHTVTYDYTDGNGCSASDNATITVNALPTPSFTSEVTEVCEGTADNVYTTQSGMSNYVWNVSAGGTITNGGTDTDNSITITWDTEGAQTVDVNYEDTNSCSGSSPAVSNVTVHPTPETQPIYRIPNK